MTRPASSRSPPPAPPPRPAHHQPLLIIFRGDATEPIELIPRVVRHVLIGSSVGRLENG